MHACTDRHPLPGPINKFTDACNTVVYHYLHSSLPMFSIQLKIVLLKKVGTDSEIIIIDIEATVHN